MNGRYFPSRAVLISVSAISLLAPGLPAHAAGQARNDRSQAAREQENKFEKMGPLLSALGEEAASLVGGDPDGIFLYVEMVDGAPAAFLFKDTGKTVRRYRDSLKLQDLVLQIWALENRDPRKRWVAMEYDVRGRTFDAYNVFPEEFDAASDLDGRVAAALSVRSPGKRVRMDKALRASLKKD